MKFRSASSPSLSTDVSDAAGSSRKIGSSSSGGSLSLLQKIHCGVSKRERKLLQQQQEQEAQKETIMPPKITINTKSLMDDDATYYENESQEVMPVPIYRYTASGKPPLVPTSSSAFSSTSPTASSKKTASSSPTSVLQAPVPPPPLTKSASNKDLDRKRLEYSVQKKKKAQLESAAGNYSNSLIVLSRSQSSSSNEEQTLVASASLPAESPKKLTLDSGKTQQVQVSYSKQQRRKSEPPAWTRVPARIVMASTANYPTSVNMQLPDNSIAVDDSYQVTEIMNDDGSTHILDTSFELVSDEYSELKPFRMSGYGNDGDDISSIPKSSSSDDDDDDDDSYDESDDDVDESASYGYFSKLRSKSNLKDGHHDKSLYSRSDLLRNSSTCDSTTLDDDLSYSQDGSSYYSTTRTLDRTASNKKKNASSSSAIQNTIRDAAEKGLLACVAEDLQEVAHLVMSQQHNPLCAAFGAGTKNTKNKKKNNDCGTTTQQKETRKKHQRQLT